MGSEMCIRDRGCADGCGSAFGGTWNILDRVRVPRGLAPGDYVLSWRWDAEELPQVQGPPPPSLFLLVPLCVCVSRCFTVAVSYRCGRTALTCGWRRATGEWRLRPWGAGPAGLRLRLGAHNSSLLYEASQCTMLSPLVSLELAYAGAAAAGRAPHGSPGMAGRGRGWVGAGAGLCCAATTVLRGLLVYRSFS